MQEDGILQQRCKTDPVIRVCQQMSHNKDAPEYYRLEGSPPVKTSEKRLRVDGPSDHPTKKREEIQESLFLERRGSQNEPFFMDVSWMFGSFFSTTNSTPSRLRSHLGFESGPRVPTMAPVAFWELEAI